MTGKRLTGSERDKVAADLRKRYEAGATIQQLVDQTGRSYGAITTLLRDASTTMRPRGTRRASQ